MININNKPIIYIKQNNIDVIRVLLNNTIVWELDDIKSCFAKGYWIDEYPWTDEYPWKDIN